jgi:hypothetical protein
MRLLALSCLLLVGAAGAVFAADTAGPAAVVLDDFDKQSTPGFPAAWKTRDTATAKDVYKVVDEAGGRVLKAVANGSSAQIALPVSLAIEDYPVLSWRWRADALPPGAAEHQKATNDSAAGVYVVFKGSFGGLVPRAIKYVWSATEPEGASFTSPGYPNAYIVVLRSGNDQPGTWRTETVDAAADYRRLFGEAPPIWQGIAVLTDSDNTNTTAAASYDDFRALRRGAAGAALARGSH